MNVLPKFSLLKKAVVFVSTLVLFCSSLNAAIETASNRISGSSVIQAASVTAVDNKYNYMVANSGTWYSDFKVASGKGRVRVGVDHSSLTYVSTDYDYTFHLKIEYIDTTLGAPVTIYRQLRAAYDHAAANSYNDAALYEVNTKKVIWIRATIDSIYDNVHSTYTGTVQNNMFLETSTVVERYYPVDYTTVPSSSSLFYTIPSTAGVTDSNEVRVAWNYLDGAESYDLEWTYVNDYGENYLTNNNDTILPDSLAYDFTHNSTRINTTAQHYNIPLLFDRGYLLFRIRAVGAAWQSSSGEWKRVYGKWTSDGVGSADTVGNLPVGHVYHIYTPHESIKNWQYVGTFAEEGKKKEVVSYYDGTLRNRQTVTKTSTDKKVLIGETFYDFQGRAAVTALPAPVTGTDEELKFYDGFNRNDSTGSHAKTYNRFDFDRDVSSCVTATYPMGIDSGASRYYSAYNPEKNAQQAWLPDAEKYPFAQVEYMPDNTGRIRRQSGVGPNHQLGSGHETQYFYGQPFQEELDRLFGSEAGYQKHYNKTVTLDANGQASVTYMDQEGRTIATALAGTPPSNLDPLVNSGGTPLYTASLQTIDADLLGKDSAAAVDADQDNNIISPDGRTLTVNTQLTVTSPQTYSFSYSLTGAKFSPGCLPVDVCYQCVYDMNISIRNQCGTALIDTTKLVGSFDTACAHSAASFTINPGDLDVSLDIGVYTVTKTLAVNDSVMELYWENYLAQSTCVRTEQSFIDSALANVDTSGCNIVCDTCGDNEFQSACEASYQMMLSDVSPGGQYAEYLVSGSPAPTQYPLSVLNDVSNALPMLYANWRHPREIDSLMYYTRIDSVHYFEADDTTISRIALVQTSSTTYSPAIVGTANIVMVNGTPTVEPFELADVNDFAVTYWKPSWAKSLVIYHPEYVYFQWCKEDMVGQGSGADTLSSDEYDSLLLVTNTISAAHALHLLDPLGNAYASPSQGNCRDPYFRAAGQGSAQYNVSGTTPDACQFSQNYQGSGLSIWKLAKVSTTCGTVYGTSTDIDNCLIANLGSLPTNDTNYIVTDNDWLTFRALYFSIKSHFQGEAADSVAFDNDDYNGCIGNMIYNPLAAGMLDGFPAINMPFYDTYDLDRRQPCGYTYPLYQYKLKRFPNENDLNPSIAAAWAGNPGALVDTSLANGYNYYLQTGQCPQAFALQQLLNDIAATDSLKATGDSLLHYNAFTQQLYSSMVSSTPFRYPTYTGTGSGSTLTMAFSGTGVSCSSLTLTFTSAPYSWSAYNSSWRIEGFSQLTATGSSSFTVVAAIDDDMNSATTPLYTTMSGSSGCFTIQCSFADVCEPSDEAYELVTLLNLLGANGTLYTTSSPGDTLTSDTIGAWFNNTQLRNRLGTGPLFWLKTSPTAFKIWDGTNIYPSFVVTLGSLPTGVTYFDSIAIVDSANATLIAHNGSSTTVSLSAVWHHSVGASNYDTNWILGDCGPATPAACTGDEYQRRDDLQAFFNQLAVDDLLKSASPSGTSLNNYGVFTSLLEAPLGFSDYRWVGTTSSLTLTGELYNMSDTSIACTSTLTFSTTPGGSYNWGDVTYITGLWADESNLFNGVAYGFSGIAWFPDNSSVSFTGTSCWAIRNCSVCLANAGNTYENFDNASSSPGTTLTYTASCPGTNYYTITNDASTLCGSGAIQGVDHTRRDSTGNYFFTKYSSNGAQTIWQKNTSVTAYTPYTFSVWYMDADTITNTHVDLELWVDSTLVTSVTVTDNVGVWKKLEGTWNGRNSAGTDTLKIKTSGSGSVNTMLGIDDIGFYTIGCDPPIALTLSPTYPFCDSCAQNQLNLAVANAQSQYQQYIDSTEADFKAQYISHCIGSAVETFNVEYDLNEYHYTLYYYDQGGNLVRTVPPEGVNIIDLATYGQDIRDDRSARTANPSATKTFFTSHTLATTYTYNTLNQLVQQVTPDGDTTHFWYDALGRIVASQNAKQAVPDGSSEVRYSYTHYDAQGRIAEVGELSTTNDLGAQTFATQQTWLNDYNYPDLLDGGAVSNSNYRYQVTRTYYDAITFSSAAARMPSGTQDNLRKRVVSAAIYPLYDGTDAGYSSASHYSYDIHGNVKELVQEDTTLRALDDAGNSRYQSYRSFEYFYDLVSGKVNELWYEDGQADAFYYKYEYDADNRVTAAYTSTDNRQWDRDAKYFYYPHGPLARTEIGQNKVQGMDYAYTLLGWIKGVNSNSLTASNDMGKDAYGSAGNPNAYIPEDEYGYELTYYDTVGHHDYTSISTNPAFAAQSGSGLEAGAANLWNGNIKNMVTSIAHFEDYTSGSKAVVAKAFQYDQLNRIMQAEAYKNYNYSSNSWESGGTKNEWKENFTYDENGNIKTLIRHGDTTSIPMDSLNYHYTSGTNQLEYVDDISSSYSDDIDDQASGNYNYDKIGNLVSDISEEIDTIKWNVYGKITDVIRSTTSSKSDLHFDYDAMGQRICKIVKPRNGSGVLNQAEWTYTYYVRDAQGNTIAVYDRDFIHPDTKFYDVLTQKENHLYGSSRVGVKNDTTRLASQQYSFVAYNADSTFDLSTPNTLTSTATDANSFVHEMGRKSYELVNHLGNVLVTVSDMRTANYSGVTVTGWNAVVNSTTDYYAFGAPMPGRNYSSASYRYGFNGQEKVDEVHGNSGDAYDFGARIYDARLGRWLSSDPFTNKFLNVSPYSFADNSPIVAVDINGDSVYTRHYERTYTDQEGRTVIEEWNCVFVVGKIIDETTDDPNDSKAPAVATEMNKRLGGGEEKTLRGVSTDGNTINITHNCIFTSFTAVNSMSEVSSTDHLIVIVDKVPGTADPKLGGGPRGGEAAKNGHVAYIENSDDAQHMTESAIHEIGHTLGLDHVYSEEHSDHGEYSEENNHSYMSYDKNKDHFTWMQIQIMYNMTNNGKNNQGHNSVLSTKKDDNTFWHTSSPQEPYRMDVKVGERIPTPNPDPE